MRTLVKPGEKAKLTKIDPASTAGVPERNEAEKQSDAWAETIGERQYAMYVNGRRSLLVVLQGMDTSGKDGTIRHVFGRINPAGVSVTSFKSPTPLEARHDFLWRAHLAVPPRGVLGIFNRSYYEEVGIVRVHAEKFLAPELRHDKKIWDKRHALINDFERLLSLNGTQVLKFFLHISREEQKERFEERQSDPSKHWKLDAADFAEREFWDDYMRVYSETLAATSTELAPWHIIPADRKWVRNYHISRIVAETLEAMQLDPPPVSDPALLKVKIK